MNWPLLGNSLLVSGATVLLASGLGWLVALAGGCLGPGARRWLVAGSVLALVLPPFLVTNCWLELAGPDPRWTPWLRLQSLAGTVWLLTLLTWPLTTLFALGAWSRLQASHLEIEPLARGSRFCRRLLWPMARPALGQAAALTFVLALNNFSVPVILQVKVFPEDLWLAFTTRLDEAGAWAASFPMVLFPVLLLFLWQRSGVAWPKYSANASAQAFRQQLGTGWTVAAGGVTGVLLLLTLGLPLQRIACSSRTWTEMPNLWRAAPDTIWNSFVYAAVAASAALLVAMVSWRLRLGLILWLPFLLPGVLLGRLMIGLLNNSVLYGTAALVMLLFSIRYLAPGWNVVAEARRTVDPDLTDAARLYGARGWSLFRHVLWPQMSGQLAAAWYVTYLLCLWDVETLVLIYPPGGETLALRVFNLLHYGHNAQVNALCATLLGLAAAPLLVWKVGHYMLSPSGQRTRSHDP